MREKVVGGRHGQGQGQHGRHHEPSLSARVRGGFSWHLLLLLLLLAASPSSSSALRGAAPASGGGGVRKAEQAKGTLWRGKSAGEGVELSSEGGMHHGGVTPAVGGEVGVTLYSLYKQRLSTTVTVSSHPDGNSPGIPASSSSSSLRGSRPAASDEAGEEEDGGGGGSRGGGGRVGTNEVGLGEQPASRPDWYNALLAACLRMTDGLVGGGTTGAILLPTGPWPTEGGEEAEEEEEEDFFFTAAPVPGSIVADGSNGNGDPTSVHITYERIFAFEYAPFGLPSSSHLPSGSLQTFLNALEDAEAIQMAVESHLLQTTGWGHVTVSRPVVAVEEAGFWTSSSATPWMMTDTGSQLAEKGAEVEGDGETVMLLRNGDAAAASAAIVAGERRTLQDGQGEGGGGEVSITSVSSSSSAMREQQEQTQDQLILDGQGTAQESSNGERKESIFHLDATDEVVMLGSGAVCVALVLTGLVLYNKKRHVTKTEELKQKNMRDPDILVVAPRSQSGLGQTGDSQVLPDDCQDPSGLSDIDLSDFGNELASTQRSNGAGGVDDDFIFEDADFPNNEGTGGERGTLGGTGGSSVGLSSSSGHSNTGTREFDFTPPPGPPPETFAPYRPETQTKAQKKKQQQQQEEEEEESVAVPVPDSFANPSSSSAARDTAEEQGGDAALGDTGSSSSSSSSPEKNSTEKNMKGAAKGFKERPKSRNQRMASEVVVDTSNNSSGSISVSSSIAWVKGCTKSTMGAWVKNVKVNVTKGNVSTPNINIDSGTNSYTGSSMGSSRSSSSSGNSRYVPSSSGSSSCRPDSSSSSADGDSVAMSVNTHSPYSVANDGFSKHVEEAKKEERDVSVSSSADTARAGTVAAAAAAVSPSAAAATGSSPTTTASPSGAEVSPSAGNASPSDDGGDGSPIGTEGTTPNAANKEDARRARLARLAREGRMVSENEKERLRRESERKSQPDISPSSRFTDGDDGRSRSRMGSSVTGGGSNSSHSRSSSQEEQGQGHGTTTGDDQLPPGPKVEKVAISSERSAVTAASVAAAAGGSSRAGDTIATPRSERSESSYGSGGSDGSQRYGSNASSSDGGGRRAMSPLRAAASSSSRGGREGGMAADGADGAVSSEAPSSQRSFKTNDTSFSAFFRSNASDDVSLSDLAHVGDGKSSVSREMGRLPSDVVSERGIADDDDDDDTDSDEEEEQSAASRRTESRVEL